MSVSHYKSFKILGITCFILTFLKMTHGISRFGPEPKHFNSKSLQPHTANFRTIGNYAAHTETITVRIPFNFLTFHSQINNALTRINNFTNHINHYSQDKIAKITTLHKQVLHDYRQELQDITAILPQKAQPTSPNPRHKRFFGAVLATAALGFTSANRISIIEDERKIATLDHKTDYGVHLGDTFFCKGRRELRTDTEQECLTSLYFGAMDHIRRNCGFKIAQAREQIFEVQENTWLIFPMGPMVTNQVCKKKKMTPIKINSGNPPAYKPTAPQTFNVVY